MVKISAAIFDFDGTIVNGFSAAIATVNELAVEYGYPQVTPEDIRLFRAQGAQALLKKIKIPIWKLPMLLIRGRELNRPKLLTSPLVADIKPILKKIRAQVDFLGIVSTNSVQTIHQYLGAHDLDFFDEVKECGIFDKSKQLVKMLKQRQLDFPTTVYVGDEPRDIAAARQAGIMSLAVGWGFTDLARLKKDHPSWTVDRPDQLLQIIGQ